jgi:O-6-methylguanine DNA methyltransferase
MSVVRAYVDRIETPLGPMLAVATSDELLLLEFADRRAVPLQVRRANGDNGIAILIPCHRVIGSDGKLTGYGGGLWRKQSLLALEGAL